MGTLGVQKLAAAAAALAIFALGGELPAWAAVGAVALVLVLLGVAESITADS
jgi:hypothetical protein